ncbi:hypothetical protein [Streptomyces sp. NPDC056160]|uniref:hypothetical protein n=1 Tax=Streptomyces sp. NPDC056160 TaxID=3345731 RepID=UPI0035E3673E
MTAPEAELRADTVALARASVRPVVRIAAELGMNHETLFRRVYVGGHYPHDVTTRSALPCPSPT